MNCLTKFRMETWKENQTLNITASVPSFHGCWAAQMVEWAFALLRHPPPLSAFSLSMPLLNGGPSGVTWCWQHHSV